MNIEYPQTRPGLTYDLTLGLSSALAGADTIVAGSAVFGAPDADCGYRGIIGRLRAAATAR